MNSRHRVAVPHLDAGDLTALASLEADDGSIAEFTFAGQVRDLDLTGLLLRAGMLDGVEARRVLLAAGTHLQSVLLTDCSFTALRGENSRLTRVAFRGCRLMGATFEDCTLEKAAVENCDLRATEFGPGKYRNLDLRGSDLSRVIGASRLCGAIISPDQEHQLAQALIAALDLTIADA